jgi:CRP-like cAMP-binding protein
MPKLWYIRGLPLFSGDSDLAERLRTVGRVERWGHRAAIAHREDPTEVQVILSGHVELADGLHDAVTRLSPGDVFGELGDSSAESILRAYDNVLIASLRRTAFEEQTKDRLGELATIVGFVRRRSLSVPVASLLYTTPRRRIAGVLLHFVESAGSLEDDRGELDFVPSNRSLARLSGLADPTVSDIVNAYSRDRVVEVGRTNLVIPSLERIRQLAIG